MARTPDDIVRAEILVCVSSLVSTLAGDYGRDFERTDLGALVEQAFELAAPIPDYESAARDAGWTPTQDNAEIRRDGERVSCSGADRWQVACERDNIEPHDREVYEHWAITSWLADKLEAKGEKVDRDFAGLTVWARTTTGQMVAADWVIEQIVADLAREYGA